VQWPGVEPVTWALRSHRASRSAHPNNARQCANARASTKTLRYQSCASAQHPTTPHDTPNSTHARTRAHTNTCTCASNHMHALTHTCRCAHARTLTSNVQLVGCGRCARAMSATHVSRLSVNVNCPHASSGSAICKGVARFHSRQQSRKRSPRAVGERRTRADRGGGAGFASRAAACQVHARFEIEQPGCRLRARVRRRPPAPPS
jgi:hypothetical protein